MEIQYGIPQLLIKITICAWNWREETIKMDETSEKYVEFTFYSAHDWVPQTTLYQKKYKRRTH